MSTVLFYPKQSIPILELFSVTCLDLASATTSIGFNPLFSANAVGIVSKASAKALMAYYSTDSIKSAYLFNSRAHAISAEPPP